MANQEQQVRSFSGWWALVAIMTFVAPLVGRMPQALASPCDEAVHAVLSYTSTSPDNHFGVKASTGLWVAATPPDAVCVRVSSLIAVHNDNNQVEIGWFEDPTQAQPGCNYPSGETAPRRLLVSILSAHFSCEYIGTPPKVTPTNDYHPFNVHEDDPSTCTTSNAAYDYVDDSTTVTFVYTSFCNAWSTTNGERHGTADSAFTDDEGLQFYGASGGWQAWTDTAKFCDTDNGVSGDSSGYDLNIVNDQRIKDEKHTPNGDSGGPCP